MTKLLETAITKLRKLPEELQTLAAEHLIEYVEDFPPAEKCISIEEARDAYDRGDFLTISRWRQDLGLTD